MKRRLTSWGKVFLARSGLCRGGGGGGIDAHGRLDGQGLAQAGAELAVGLVEVLDDDVGDADDALETRDEQAGDFQWKFLRGDDVDGLEVCAVELAFRGGRGLVGVCCVVRVPALGDYGDCVGALEGRAPLGVREEGQVADNVGQRLAVNLGAVGHDGVDHVLVEVAVQKHVEVRVEVGHSELEYGWEMV